MAKSLVTETFTKINGLLIAADYGLASLLISEKRALGLHLALFIRASLYFTTGAETAIVCTTREDFMTPTFSFHYSTFRGEPRRGASRRATSSFSGARSSKTLLIV